MKRKIEIIAVQRTRTIVANGLSYCHVCQRFAELLTTTQAGEIAKVNVISIRRWLDAGRAHGVKTAGGQHRVCRESLFQVAHSNKDIYVTNRSK